MNKRQEFKVHGMDCAEEVAALKAALLPLAGVQDLAFDVLNAKMTVEYAPETVKVERIHAEVKKTGMRLEPWGEAPKAQSTLWGKWGRSATTAGSGVCLVAGFLVHVGLEGLRASLGEGEGAALPLATRVLYLLALVLGAWHVAPKGVRALFKLRPDMNLLMTAAVLGALAIDEVFEAATVAFLFSVSLALESWSVGRARRAIAALMSLAPETARVKNVDGSESTVPVADVPVESHVLILPGEKFPLDGKLLRGETTVNQAPITGESLPVSKNVGDEVYAGTINEDGAVEIVTTRPATDTTLAKIIRMVGDAQSKRSPSEQWVEKFARYYTPSVMVFSILVMVVPPLIFQKEWQVWLYEGLVLLVIACPCALVISTPVSIVAALAASARRGVLVKGGAYMETSAGIQVVALDKTGTITEGMPQVFRVISQEGHTEEEVLRTATALELLSQHPLAKAIVRHAESLGLKVKAADGFQAIKGKGGTGSIDGKEVWVGSHLLLDEKKLETPELHELLKSLEKNGASLVVVGDKTSVHGAVAITDKIRPAAKAAIQKLRLLGVRHIIMLSGDNKGTAESIGKEAGVDEAWGELLPEDKVSRIEKLVGEFGQVAMVGDGVNDAPAMARASLGVAMGAVGTDAALETADVALMSDDLNGLPWLIEHSRRTLSVIRQNIFASIGVKVLFVILTLLGYASLWVAISADMGMSLAVIFNGLRLLRSPDVVQKAG